MLHLRDLGLLRLDALTATGYSWGEVLQWWQDSDRRRHVRQQLLDRDGICADDVILPPSQATKRGMTSTVCFPIGNLCPEGSVIKATAIDPQVVDDDGVFRMTGPARVFTRERDAIAAIKGQMDPPVKAGDVVVLAGRGPLGSGMEETYQITSALKFLPFGKHVAVVTDARFSGVSTGACIGHVGPEALAGGPLGKLVDGDLIRIVVDRNQLVGSVDFVGTASQAYSSEEAAQILAQRPMRDNLQPDVDLPDDTRLWAALQSLGGGTWGGCVYDVDAIIKRLTIG
jgi:dihydroxyacid dehydratase/phosphogluconate dehydratase